MPTTQRNGIEFNDVDGYRETNTEETQQAIRPVQTAWSNVTTFPSSVLGIHTIGQGGKLSRLVPESHPWNGNWYCVSCELQHGLGVLTYDVGSGRFVYEDRCNDQRRGDGFARYTLTYSPYQFKVLTDAQIANSTAAVGELRRYVWRKKVPAAEALTIGGSGFKWDAAPPDDKTISEPGTKLFPSTQWDYVWHWVPQEVADRNLDSYIGRVNSAVFDTAKMSGAVGTVLFLGAEDSDPVYDGAGNQCIHRTYKFLKRPYSWNSFYRQRGPAGPGFYPVIARDGSGVKPYESADLNNLFTATY